MCCCIVAGEKVKGQRVIEFRLGGDAGRGVSVESAEVVVRAEAGRGARRAPYTLWAFTARNGSVGDLAGATARRPGHYQRIDVTSAARAWAGKGPLRLLLDCSGCAGGVRLRLGGAQAYRPLLRLRVETPAPRTRRHAVDCENAPSGHCCRQTHYVSFRELGWDDWIVAPEGYYANYCRGSCSRSAYSYTSYYAQVVEAARLEVAACCAPTRYSALSLIYFGEDVTINKRDLPEMVVEECGCP